MISGSFRSKADGSPVGKYLGASVLVCFFLFLVLTSCKASREHQAQVAVETETEKQISYFRSKIAESERHYPSYAFLADALLRRSRETGDHTLLPDVRKNAEKSLAIQPNYIALKTMAMLCNHTHRFADAIEWSHKTVNASSEGLDRDSELTAILVEAYLGMGENGKAAELLERLASVGKKEDDFYSASARGALLKAENNIDEAVMAFEAAREFAAMQGANSRVVWSNVMAAGCLLDSGRSAEAEPYLKLAKAMDPKYTVLQIHEAEFLLASDQPDEALKIYEQLLSISDDPEVHHRAFVIARDLGDRTNAANHFAAAEKGFQKILDSGEIFSLGPMSQLYCDEGTDLDKALELALQNLEYKRDGEAQDALRCVRERTGR